MPSGFSRAFKVVGLRRENRIFPGAFPDTQDPGAGAREADSVPGAARGAAGAGRSPPPARFRNSCRPITPIPADGDVTAPLVYVNYGNREDYEQLDRLGISVKGAIVIARYGGGWRGVKPKVAGGARRGRLHHLLGSAGRWLPSRRFISCRRVAPQGGGCSAAASWIPTNPGDPLTPGVGATAQAKRLALKDAKTITAIPVLPISYADALPLLIRARRPGGARALARRARHHLPRRAGDLRSCISQ